MSNQGVMRAEFEEWLAETLGVDFVKNIDNARDDAGDYRFEPAASYWVGWQASRACLCVELPKLGFCAMTNDLIGYSRGLSDCRAAIERAGVSVK
jgi:hypothetical protein